MAVSKSRRNGGARAPSPKVKRLSPRRDHGLRLRGLVRARRAPNPPQTWPGQAESLIALSPRSQGLTWGLMTQATGLGSPAKRSSARDNMQIVDDVADAWRGPRGVAGGRPLGP